MLRLLLALDSLGAGRVDERKWRRASLLDENRALQRCFLAYRSGQLADFREETEKRYAEPPPAAEQPKDVSTMSGLVPGAQEEKPAVGEVLVEMSELQEALDEVGICFDSDEDDGGAADGGVTDEMKRMMQEAGVNFGEEDSNDGANLQVEALPSNEEGLADMLALAGVVFEEEDNRLEEHPDVVLAIGDHGEEEFRI